MCFASRKKIEVVELNNLAVICAALSRDETSADCLVTTENQSKEALSTLS